jgi:hypothetical protein
MKVEEYINKQLLDLGTIKALCIITQFMKKYYTIETLIVLILMDCF